jgi:hypothetical protein
MNKAVAGGLQDATSLPLDRLVEVPSGENCKRRNFCRESSNPDCLSHQFDIERINTPEAEIRTAGVIIA